MSYCRYRLFSGITESSTDPPAVPPANQISDAFGKRRPLGRCGGGSVESDTCELQGRDWLRVGRAMSISLSDITRQPSMVIQCHRFR